MKLLQEQLQGTQRDFSQGTKTPKQISFGIQKLAIIVRDGQLLRL